MKHRNLFKSKSWRVFYTLAFLMVFTPALVAQAVITGTVRDDRGETLPGVSVLVVELGTGTVTDINGRYSVAVPQEATLVFSFMGKKTVRMQVSSRRTTVDVTLEDEAAELEAVIITGYREVSAEAYTGSAVVISSGQIALRPLGSVEEALRGVAPGLLVAASGQPGEANEVRLRGFGSMFADNQPLYVVDGVVWDQIDETGSSNTGSNPLNALNPLDIANITILRDASSAALYGSRGANGVIVITTKSGGQNERTNYSVNLQTGVAAMMIYPQLVNGPQYAELWTEGQMHFLIQQQLARDGQGTTRMRLVDELTWLYADKDNNTYNGLNYNQWMKLARQDFNKIFAMPTGDGGFRKYDFFGADADKLPSTDWYDETTRLAPFTQANISMQGGGQSLRHFVSLGYFNQQGTVINTQLQRYTMRTRISSESDRQVINWGVSNSLSYALQTGPDAGGSAFNSPMYAVVHLPSVVPAYLEDGSYNFFFPNNLLNTNHNPAASAKENINERPQTRMIIQGWVEVKNILPWLKFRTTNAMDYRLIRRHAYFDNRFGTGFRTEGELYQRDSHTRRFTSTNLFTASRNWLGRHRLNAIAGVELENHRNVFNEFRVARFAVNTKPSTSMASDVSRWIGGGSGHSQFSALSSVDYSYRFRYFVSASYRMDASSRFHPDYRVGNFWSVSGAYRITNEPWFKDIIPTKYVNNLRFRASYGVNGTIPTQLYHWREAYEANMYMNDPGAAQYFRPAEDLTWEGNRIWNFGMDVRMFDDRMRMTIEYFDRKSKDMLQEVYVPMLSGFRTMLMNTDAGIHNTGLELEIRGTPFQKGKHALDVSFNLATLKSIYYGLQTQELDAASRQILANGLSVHSWYLRDWNGVCPNTGQILYGQRTGDPAIGKFNYHYATGINSSPSETNDWLTTYYAVRGQGIPKVSGGFSIGYSYGQWTLSTLCSYAWGHHIFDRLASARIASDGTYDYAISTCQLNRWTPDNRNASSLLRLNNVAANSRYTRYLIKGDYLKIRNIRLQYSLPESAVKPMRMTAASVFVQTENPWIFTHMVGYDPELSMAGYRNFDHYPTPTTFLVGVTLNF